MVDVFRGNLAYGRGDYQGALVHYMVAVDDNREDAWTRFNIANVYYALGEHEAALEHWASARTAVELSSGESEPALLYASSYNRGVLLYQQGNYGTAYDEFRYALSVNPRNRDAKINLELSLSKMEAAEAASEAESSSGAFSLEPGESEESVDEQTLRLLEYVRRKETQEWFANRDVTTEENMRDW